MSAAVLSPADRTVTPGTWQDPPQDQALGFGKRGKGRQDYS